jgi:leader peptidase (prepilin peptidase) / N-methyltransferase
MRRWLRVVRSCTIAYLPRSQKLALIGAAALLVMAWAASADSDPRRLAFGCILGWGLLALSWIDWHTLRLPDALTLPLMGVGLATAWMDSPEALYAGVVGALAGYAALLAVGVCYRLARGQDGLGRGDAKLLAAGGAWLGVAALPWVVLLAALFGLVLAILHGARGGRLTRETTLPFGPPLALAIWIIWLYGTPGG